MSKTPRMISIAELTPGAHPDPQDIENSDRPMLWDMPLPAGVDAERITVDMRRLKLTHFSGAIAASFVDDFEGPVSSCTHDTEVQEAKLAVGLCLDPFDAVAKVRGKRHSLNSSFGHAAIAHEVNVSELTSRAEKQIAETDMKPEIIWAELYDEAIRESMIEGAHRHLMGRKKDVSKDYVMDGYLWTGLVGVGMAASIAGVPAADLALLGVSVPYLIDQFAPGVIYNKELKKGSQRLERRWSVVPHARQPDRYAAVMALCKTRGLVRYAA